MRPRTSLIDLIGLKKLREFQERFYKVTGFPNSYVDSEGNYVSKAGEAAHVCMNIIREAKEGNRRCVANDIKRTEPVEAKSQGPRTKPKGQVFILHIVPKKLSIMKS